MKTRTAAFFFAALAAAPAAQADNVTYFDPAGETNATCETCTAYTGQTTLSDGWYVVEGAVASGGRITVGGDVNLILADGAELTAEGGIRLAQGNSLTVWAQRAGTGKLTANATSEFYAGIGGNGNGNGGDTAGTLTVNGGAVSARGSGHGAGVGGGNKSAGGTVVVNGGSLTASGRDGAAGIGGGDLGHGGTVVVNGGTVTATGSTRSSSGQAAPGIGAGRPSATINKLEDHRTTGPVTINGGTVEATAGTPSGSGAGAQAIGLNLGDAGPDYAVTVYAGAKVTAGGDKAGAAPVPYTGPESLTNACANAYAKVEPCTAHEDDNGLCHWCGATYMDPVSYVDRAWNGNAVAECNATCATYTSVTSGMSTTWSAGWYVVNTNVEIGSRIEISGTVRLILCDGFTLTAKKGIHLVGNGKSLTIYGQVNDSGALTISGVEMDCAGIGGNCNDDNDSENGGALTVNGGIVNANGGRFAAGIGGGAGGYGDGGDGGAVTINGGNVTATGGEGSAGIGGGDAGFGTGGAGGTVAINGGIVTAKGGERAAGIGGGYGDGGDGGDGGNVTVNGGTVTANGGVWAAGIGGGFGDYGGGNGDTVTVNGGTVIAKAGSSDAQAIGGGRGDGGSTGAPGTLTIDGMKAGYADGNGNVASWVASGERDGCCRNKEGKRVRIEVCDPHDYGESGACSHCGTVGFVTYVDRAWDGSAVVESNATCATYTSVTSGMSTAWSAGCYVVDSNVEIGSRIEISGAVRLILCDGFTLTAKKGIHLTGNGKSLTIYGQVNDSGALTISGVERDHAGIGGNGNDHSSGEDGGALTINGGTVKVNGGELGAGIGGGASLDVGGGGGGNVTVNGGNVTANGGERGAGIGGGSGNDVVGGGGTVTVNGGNVTANGGQNAAGIGGGVGNAVGGAGGNVTVKGGTVIAKAGSSYAQAIGGGQGNGGSTGAPGTLTIDGMKAGYADSNGNVASWAAFGERDGCCRNKEGKRVRIEVCDPHEYGKNGVCAHCGASGGPVDYFDPMGGTNATCAAYTPYVGQAELTNGWYVVTGTVLSINRVTVSDDVNLILVDDTTLTAALGITVANANSLTIWAQGAGGNEGTLFAGTTNGVNCLCGPNQAGVGGAGQGAAGRVAVNGGKVVANGGLGASGVGGTDGTVAIGQGRMILTPQGGRVSDDGSVVVDADGVAARKVVIGTPVPVLLLDEIPSQVYTGSALSPSLTVTCLGASLEEGTDYTVAYSANGVAAAEIRNAGEYTVTVTGAGDYAGAQEASGVFAVTKASLTITAKDQTYRYNGMQQGESDPLYATPEEIAEKVIVNGLKGGDTIDHVELGGEATDAGCYPIEPRGAAVVNPNNVFVTENYDITYVNGTLTILGPAEVSGVQAAAQEPWNGKISLSFTVTNSPAACLPDWNAPFLSIVATDNVTGSNYVSVASALSDNTDAADGPHTVTWDFDAQGIDFVSTNVTFTVAYLRMPDYCVIDLSGGTNAVSYPVTYLAAEPDGGFTNDLYRTTKLAMRLIGPETFTMGASSSDVDDNPPHSVTLTQPFYCAVFETTQRQWELVTGERPSWFTNETYYATRPVEQVSWNMIRGNADTYNWPDVQGVDPESFLGVLRQKTDLNALDLPTDAAPARPASTTMAATPRATSRPSVATGTTAAPITAIPAPQTLARRQSAPTSRTPGASTTCTATCGSGASIPRGRAG